MPRKRQTDRTDRRPITIVSIQLPPQEKAKLDSVSDQRGMTIKSLLGRLIDWFAERDTTEQAIILGQVEDRDAMKFAEMLAPRK